MRASNRANLNDTGSDASAPTEPSKQKLSRHRYTDLQEETLLRLYKIDPKKWSLIHQTFIQSQSGVSVSERAIRERIEGLIRKFRANNPLLIDRWKMGDRTSGIPEKDRLLVEIVIMEDKFANHKTGKRKEILDQETDEEAFEEFPPEIYPSKKSKGMEELETSALDPLSGAGSTPIESHSVNDANPSWQSPSGEHERRLLGSWPSEVDDLLRNAIAMDVEKDKIKLETRRLELEEQREKRLAAEQAARDAQSLAITQLLTGLTSLITSLQNQLNR